ncbi:MAG: hypothetical protein AAGU14_00825 [Eubacteriaceae bacterium]
MKKKRLMTSIVLLLMLISFMAPLSANTSVTVVSNIDYKAVQLDNDTLFEMAMDGNLVNNNHTKVSVYKNDGQEKVFEIKKLLSKKVYSDGTVEESNSDELIGTKSIHTMEKTGTDDMYTVRLKVGAQYDTKTLGTDTYVKIIKFWCTPTRLDSTFFLKSLSGVAVEKGVSYEGQPLDIRSYLSTITNPVSGQQYNKTTNFTKYVQIDNGAFSYAQVLGTLKYGRGTSTYTFNLYLNII